MQNNEKTGIITALGQLATIFRYSIAQEKAQ